MTKVERAYDTNATQVGVHTVSFYYATDEALK